MREPDEPLLPTDEVPVAPADLPAHAPRPTDDPEVPEADALEQSIGVPVDDDEG